MNAAEILNQENEIARMRRGELLHWHERTLTEGQLVEMVYGKPLEEVLKLVPPTHRAMAMRSLKINEWYVAIDGLRQSGGPSVTPLLIVEPLPQPQFPVRFEFVGRFEGDGVKTLPLDHLAVDQFLVLGEGDTPKGYYDLYRLVRG